MNKMKTLEYSQKIFRLELAIQAILLILLFMSPVKLVSITNSLVYILLYFILYKTVIKKSNMKRLLIFNVLLNIVPPLYIYINICLNYDKSLTKLGIPLFTILTMVSAFSAYKVVMSKTKLKGAASIGLSTFIISQFMINSLEVYTGIMILFILSTFIFVRYTLECYRMYKYKEEYIYY